jgi:hypothetical protein
LEVAVLGPGQFEQDDSRGELDTGEEISGKLVVGRGNGAKVLELVEEAGQTSLNQVTGLTRSADLMGLEIELKDPLPAATWILYVDGE